MAAGLLPAFLLVGVTAHFMGDIGAGGLVCEQSCYPNNSPVQALALQAIGIMAFVGLLGFAVKHAPGKVIRR